MISLNLRIFLILIPIVFISVVIRRINKKKLLLQYSLSWLLLSFAMTVTGIFPEIASYFSRVLRIKEPSNLVYAVGLFILLFLLFGLTCKLSVQTVQIKELVQNEAIDRFMREEGRDTSFKDPSEG